MICKNCAEALEKEVRKNPFNMLISEASETIIDVENILLNNMFFRIMNCSRCKFSLIGYLNENHIVFDEDEKQWVRYPIHILDLTK